MHLFALPVPRRTPCCTACTSIANLLNRSIWWSCCGGCGPTCLVMATRLRSLWISLGTSASPHHKCWRRCVCVCVCVCVYFALHVHVCVHMMSTHSSRRSSDYTGDKFLCLMDLVHGTRSGGSSRLVRIVP